MVGMESHQTLASGYLFGCSGPLDTPQSYQRSAQTTPHILDSIYRMTSNIMAVGIRWWVKT